MKTKVLIIFTCFSFTLMSQTPIFLNDFSDSNDWTMVDISNGGSQNWVITTNGPIGPYSGSMNPISSTTSANGFALYDSDGLNTTGTGAQNALLTYNGFVDCSAYDNININFESYHRKFQNIIYLEVTTDPNWISYSQFEINSTLGVTYSTPNPEVVSFNISTVAANQPVVYFRFHYYGGDDYAWMIDDVSFTEIPNHFLTIDSETFGGGLLGSGIDYTFTPIGQASSSPYQFEAVINNEGVEAQNNVMLNTSVDDPTSSTTVYTSNAISLPSSQTFTLASSTNFTPSIIGLHEFTYWASSDSTTSSTTVRKAMVTDSVYAVDSDWDSDGSTVTGGGYSSGAACGGQVLGNTFDIYDNAVVTSISFHVNSSSIAGAELNVELYEAIGKTLVATSSNYILTANDIGSWVTLQLVNPYLVLSGSSYIAAVRGNQHPTNSSMISSAFSTTNSSSWLLDGGCNGSPGTWFTLSHSLLIRMNLPICTSSNTINETACDSYIWAINGQTYTTSGTYTDISTNANGCDHTETLNLTIIAHISDSTTLTACDSYTWSVYGQNYTVTTSGIYNQTFINASGCDSVHTLLATINYSDTGSTSVTACDFYTWNNQVITTSASYNQTFTNISGCDSVHTLVATINYSNSNSNIGTSAVTACDYYSWYSQVITQSGSYNQTFFNAAGCDSVHTLVATINYSTVTNIQDTICQGDTIFVGNSYYTISGTYSDILTTIHGCDSIITLNLTISSSTSIDVQTACDSYTWIDGNTYTANNNTATFTIAGGNGCDSVITLNLTISSSTSIDVQTACDSYTWIDGNTYTASNNTATYTAQTSNGCDSIITLDLTINSSSTSIDVQTACDTYTWIDGNTYAASNNTATNTVAGSNGCDSVITLDLTITGNPIATITQAGLDLDVSVVGGNTPFLYQWNTIETTQTITPLMNGIYWCVVTDDNGCISDTVYFTVTWISTDITELDIVDLSIYPNPSEDVFNITFTSEKKQNIEIRIINVIGENIFIESKQQFVGEYTKQIDLEEYPKAIYFLEIKTDDGVINKKLILQ